MESTYSISDLEQATGIPRRTIYYYTTEKLIPPPTGAGLAARYGEVHYLRLRLITQMQKAHIRLSGIREALDALAVEEMRNLVSQLGAADSSWTMPALENWILGDTPDQPMPSASQGKEKPVDKNYSLLSSPDLTGPPPAGSREPFLSRLKRKTVVDTTSWQRYVIIDGLEVSIRSDVAAKHGAVLLNLLEQLKKHLGKG